MLFRNGIAGSSGFVSYRDMKVGDVIDKDDGSVVLEEDVVWLEE